jgi:hypothetical protein
VDINRSRPPKGGDIEVWLAGVINDAMRDAREAGVKSRYIAIIALSLARHAAVFACMTDREILEVVKVEHLDKSKPTLGTLGRNDLDGAIKVARALAKEGELEREDMLMLIRMQDDPAELIAKLEAEGIKAQR